MSATASQNATVLLTRLLSLKEGSSFHLILDSLTQSAYYLIEEYIHRLAPNSHNIIYVSFETINRPDYASEFVDCSSISSQQIIEKILALKGASNGKTLVIVDSLNYIPSYEISSFVAKLVGPTTTLLGVYHTQTPVPISKYPNYPPTMTLLTYIASTIYELYPITPDSIDDEHLEDAVSKLNFPINSKLNDQTFHVVLTYRRKSGRSLIYKLRINGRTHEYEIWKDLQDVETVEEDESLLRDLTTFNLTTSSKQKLAREQVELPYMQAQESLGAAGGAIVYEFEKDDDYDEEDPYEDPF
ncbi:Elongator complex protein 5 [Candida viswanathii]|uniref:Elongator complex protein 5 n=1 Tax=Candida viswanathii TaxID=5486 RepID=A0A367YAC3_9ASCO|nr:Elongator complex protein 5 [Candida viswanathii]